MEHPESVVSQTTSLAATTSFPPLAKLDIQLSIESQDWTIYPGPPETRWDFIVGFPLELHPFAWDYLKIGAEPEAVTIQPHYRESTWDTFRIEVTGHVTCTALGGLFPFTLGRQPELLEGLRETIRVLPGKVEGGNPDAAKTLVEIEAVLAAIEMHLRTLPAEDLRKEREMHRAKQRETARGRAAERFWERKRRRARKKPPRGE